MSPRLAALARGLRLRCPHCASRGLYRGYFTMRERCPGCGLKFAREDGYWLGAMVVALGVTELVFGAWFVGGMLLTWPEVPWTTLLVGGVVLNVVIPVAGYPWARTTWLGLHHAFVPTDAVEQAEAVTAREAERRRADLPVEP